MKNLQTYSQQKYLELMDGLSIAQIIIPKMDFSLSQGCTLPVLKYETKIKRSESVTSVSVKHVTVAFGFEVIGSTNDRSVFRAHVNFLIVYNLVETNTDKVTELLNDDDVKNVFLTTQSDKLVWPYFRKTLQEMVINAGLAPVVLPLYR